MSKLRKKSYPKPPRIKIEVEYPSSFEARADEDVGLGHSIYYPDMPLMHEGGEHAIFCWCDPDIELLEDGSTIKVHHHHTEH